jgi:hypothetical protein
MSEEEIIDIAEKIADFGWSDYDDFEKNKKAIQGLLDLYNKEKRKNKRYLKYLVNKDKHYESVLECLEIEKEQDYISKDKIRERIEEIRKIFPNDVMFTREFLITELKGLLEKRI